MAIIDCSTVIGFAHEAGRVCAMHEECNECPFSGRKKCPMAVLEYDKPDVQSIVDDLQAWSDEHPAKTRLEDLLEKHPNIPLKDDEEPDFYPSSLGYCGSCMNCKKFTERHCWHEPVDGGATGKAVTGKCSEGAMCCGEPRIEEI